MNFKLSLEAKENIKDIYNYGANQFNEKQAAVFYNELFAFFEFIASNPELYPLTLKKYRKATFKSHTIYYKYEIMVLIVGIETNLKNFRYS